MAALVSIIVPVYRAQEYIAETMELVRRQTCTAWELLLIDDRSPDGSADEIRAVLERWKYRRVDGAEAETGQTGSMGAGSAGTGSAETNGAEAVEDYRDGDGHRVLLIRQSVNGGAARARNTGLDYAAGRYIAYLDADDVWFPEKLEQELAFMRERQAGFVFTAYEFGDERARGTGKVVHVPETLTYRQALSRTVIFTTTVLLDREVIPGELLRMPVTESEDTACWWRILRAGYTAHGLDRTLAVYRRPPKSLSSNKLRAVRRIWSLYRRQENLSMAAAAYYFVQWAYRAVMRRL